MSDYTYKTTKEANDKIVVSVTVTPARFEAVRGRVMEELSAGLKLPGFRPGKAPQAKIEAALGNKLMSETIKKLLPEVAADIVEEEKLNPVTQLEYDLQKATAEGDVEYSFSFTNYPEVKLGDFKKIKVKREVPKVEEADIAEVIGRLFNSTSDEKEKFEVEKLTEEEIATLELEGVSTLDQLKSYVQERLLDIKKRDIERDYENSLVREAIKVSKITAPEALVHDQAHAMLDEDLARIEELKVDIDDFLSAQGTTREQLHQQKHVEAQFNVETDLLFNQIAKEYSLIPTIEDVDKEIAGVDDPALRDNLNSPNGRRYVLMTLLRQNALRKLVELAGSK